MGVMTCTGYRHKNRLRKWAKDAKWTVAEAEDPEFFGLNMERYLVRVRAHKSKCTFKLLSSPSPKFCPLRPKPNPKPVKNPSPIGTGVTQ